MTEHQTTPVGIAHVWPYNRITNPDAKPISSERASDVWDELRDFTFDEDVRGDIAVITHEGAYFNQIANQFKNELQSDEVVSSRVKFYAPRQVELTIHRPATAGFTFKRPRSVAEAFTKGPDGWKEVPDASAPIVIPAEPARDEVETRTIASHLGSKAVAEEVIKDYRNHEICALVLWHPEDSAEGSDSSNLKHLPKVKAACPDLPIYIFHWDYRADKWGVERVTGEQAVTKQTVTIQWADTIKRESTQWLIPDFLPLCEVTAFSGEMDTRKSTTVIDIAAKGSTGGGTNQRWFNNTPFEAEPFSTIYAGTEDSFSTVQNRFIAAGGNPKALGKLLLDVKNERPTPDGVEVVSTPLSFDEHLSVLRDAIVEANKTALYPVGLLINDPLIAFFGNKNFNKAQDCQDILVGLKKLCEELKISIINLMHYNKTQGASAKEKTGGSQRLIEAHRMAWGFTLIDEADKESNTLIAPIKKNLIRVANSYEITTVSTPIEWEDEGVMKHDEVGVVQFVRLSDQTADGQLQEKEAKDKSKQTQLRDAILETLKNGAVAPGVVYKTLQDLGSESTILRAVNKLIKAEKVRKEGTGPSNTRWMLSAAPEQASFDPEERAA